MREEVTTNEFEQAQRKLVRDAQMAAIGQLSRRMVHDLRNPLAVVRNAVFLLKRKLPAEEAKWHEYLAMIEQAAAETDQILAALSFVSPSVPAPARKPVDLGQVLTAARQKVPSIDAFGWHFSSEPDPLVVDVDPVQVEHVFRALLTNAVEAMGVRGEITVRARRRPDWDEVEVTDTGPGVGPEVAARVFDPLFSTKRSAAGLGLTIAQHIILAHGGTLELVPGTVGATFLVRLPDSPT